MQFFFNFREKDLEKICKIWAEDKTEILIVTSVSKFEFIGSDKRVKSDTLKK